MGAKQSVEMRRAIKLVQEKGIKRAEAAMKAGVHVNSLNKVLADMAKGKGDEKRK